MIKDIIRNNMYELIIKKNYLHIKNYKSIVEIYQNKIIIILHDSKLTVLGIDLIVSALDEYEMIIKGIIKGIEIDESKD